MKKLLLPLLLVGFLAGCAHFNEDDHSVAGSSCGGCGSGGNADLMIFAELVACDHDWYTYRFTATIMGAGAPAMVSYDFGDHSEGETALSPPFQVEHTYTSCSLPVGSGPVEDGFEVMATAWYVADTVAGDLRVRPCVTCS